MVDNCHTIGRCDKKCACMLALETTRFVTRGNNASIQELMFRSSNCMHDRIWPYRRQCLKKLEFHNGACCKNAEKYCLEIEMIDTLVSARYPLASSRCQLHVFESIQVLFMLKEVHSSHLLNWIKCCHSWKFEETKTLVIKASYQNTFKQAASALFNRKIRDNGLLSYTSLNTTHHMLNYFPSTQNPRVRCRTKLISREATRVWL